MYLYFIYRLYFSVISYVHISCSLFVFQRSFAFKANHQISQPTKNIFSNKKCKETVTPARYMVGNKKVVYDESLPCDDSIRLAQYFPEMDCPASIMEASKPFFYKTCETSAMLGPFSDDVKFSYNYLLEKNKKALEEVRAKYINDFTACPITYFKEKTVVPAICPTNIPDDVEVFDTVCEVVDKKSSLCELPVQKEITADSSSESDEIMDDEVAEGLCLVDLCPEFSACEKLEENPKEEEIKTIEEKNEMLQEIVAEKIDEKEAIKEEIEEKIIEVEEISEEPCQILKCEPSLGCSGEIVPQESCECDDLTPLLETLLICEDILEEYDCSTLLDDLEEEEEDEKEAEIIEDIEKEPKEEVTKVVSEVCEPEILLNNLCRVYPLSMKRTNKISTKCNKPKPKLDKSLLDKLKRSRYYNACPNKDLYKNCPSKKKISE